MPVRSLIDEVLTKFQIEAADIARVREAGEVLRAELPEHIGAFYAWMEQHQEYKLYFADHPSRLARVKEMQMSHWHTFFDAELDERWFAARRHVGAVHAHIDLPHDIYFAGMSMSGKSLVDRLRRGGAKIADADETANSLIKMVFLDTFVVIEEISRIQKERIAASSKTLLEMSTPVTPIWEGILLLPLIGILDSERTQDVMNKTRSEEHTSELQSH